MRTILLMLALLPTLSFSQVVGITYTPGKFGAGVIAGNDNVVVGYGYGKYLANLNGSREWLEVSTISAHASVYKNSFSNTYIGFCYNNTAGNVKVMVDKSISLISLEAISIVNLGSVGALVGFDVINMEARLGLTFKIYRL